jgi:hypothetical protein
MTCAVKYANGSELALFKSAGDSHHPGAPILSTVLLGFEPPHLERTQFYCAAAVAAPPAIVMNTSMTPECHPAGMEA